MLFLLLFMSLILNGSCVLKYTGPEKEHDHDDDSILTCIENITIQYLKYAKSVVYINPISESSNMLKRLHAMNIISFNSPDSPDIHPNLAYMIVFKTVPEFLNSDEVARIVHDANWNPLARILVVVSHIVTEELNLVFDVFLQLRAAHVVILNRTLTSELYSYNPYEDFACGRYYSRIISYGKCSEVTDNIYPLKSVTGLRNCFFNVSVPHWPPWAINPALLNIGQGVLGAEQYIFDLMSQVEQFKYKFYFDYDPEAFSTVSENLTISGPMIRLFRNETDVMFGGLMLIPSRTKMFSYISGYADYVEDLKFVVKKAEKVAAWKNFYLEFSPTVWVLLMFTILLYWVVVVVLLKIQDKGRVVLVLIDGLLSHGARFKSKNPVKSVVITWALFAFLVNTFYTTSLMSLTTQPVYEDQIGDEATLLRSNYKACISSVMLGYLKSEHNNDTIFKNIESKKACKSLIYSVEAVAESQHRFTLILNSIYSFYSLQFSNHDKKPMVYQFPQPYTKVIYAIYLNKGVPIIKKLNNLAIRIRETGLTEKHLKHLNFNQSLYSAHLHRNKHNDKRSFVPLLAVPWYLHATGVCLSIIVFMTELASQYKKEKEQQDEPVIYTPYVN